MVLLRKSKEIGYISEYKLKNLKGLNVVSLPLARKFYYTDSPFMVFIHGLCCKYINVYVMGIGRAVS